MQHYDLQAQYDSRASFYGKATVTKLDDGMEFLYSYGTHVASVDGNNTASVHGLYSQTTLRHIKEFLKQHGFKAENSKQIMADYGVTR